MHIQDLDLQTDLGFSWLYLKQIRAGHLSGDCHYKRELLRGYMKIRGHEQVSFFQ